MDEGFLGYLESSPSTAEAEPLIRLADALGTTVDRLLGGDVDVPPGPGVAAAHPVLTELPVSECWRRIAPGGVGRVALTTADTPVILPVNYRVLDAAVLFRTSAAGPLATAPGTRIAFEVDRVDEVLRTGWSVLLTGRAAAATEPEATVRLAREDGPDPWAGGRRDLWIRLRPTTVTGRIIHTEEQPRGRAGGNDVLR